MVFHVQKLSTHWFFTTIRICVGLGHICPTLGEIGLRRNNVIIWAHEFCTFATRYAYLSCINLFMIIKMNDELENQRLKTYPSLYELWLKRWNIDDGMQVTGWCITYIQIASKPNLKFSLPCPRLTLHEWFTGFNYSVREALETNPRFQLILPLDSQNVAKIGQITGFLLCYFWWFRRTIIRGSSHTWKK